MPRVVVLGGAGAGKSFLLMSRYLAAVTRYVADSSQPIPLWLDMGRDLGTDRSVEQALQRESGGVWEAVRRDEEKCVIFLDALDEVLAAEDRPRGLINDLRSFLDDNRSVLAQVMIACRRHAWSRAYLDSCEPAFRIVQVDTLCPEDYTQIIEDDALREQFYEQCGRAGISGLLETAFDGFYLAQQFARGETLPATRLELLEARTDASLQAAQPDPEAAPSPGLARLRELAERLACIATFTDRRSWLRADCRSLLATDHSDPSPAPTGEEVEWLLRQPLFRRHGDEFSFTHELFREYLAAKALVPLSLRKQLQLVTAGAAADRVAVVHRGVAATLAGLSVEFRDWLAESDPVVAFLAEYTDLPANADEELTRRVIDRAIEREEAPWFDLPPRDETLGRALPHHRPADVPTFVRPYLGDGREIARLWGTACAVAWGGDTSLNDLLLELAHDADQHTEIRTNAVEAIVASGDEQAMEALLDLLDDQDDRVRGAALEVYGKVASPTPWDFIAKLLGGSTDSTLWCRLQAEVSDYGERLDAVQLRDAFAATEQHFDDLGDLKAYLLQGLLRRAGELGFADISPALAVRIWATSGTDDRRGRYEDRLTELVAGSEQLFDSIWTYCLATIDTDHTDIYRGDARKRLGQAAGDHIFDLVPQDADALSGPQRHFVSHALQEHFAKEPTSERLVVFRERASAFTGHWELQAPEPPREHDARAEKQRLFETMDMAEGNAAGEAWNALLGVAEIESIDARSVTPHIVDEVLQRLGPNARARVERSFRDCVCAVDYARETILDRPRSFTMTDELFALPFWYLREHGEHFGPAKVAEIVRCYGFHISEDDRYLDLLNEIEEADPCLWQDTVVAILEDPLSTPHKLVDRMIEDGVDFYASRAGERLRSGHVHASHLQPLLRYWHHFRPDGHIETLRSCYEVLKRNLLRGDVASYLLDGELETPVLPDLNGFQYWWQFTPLLMAMEQDDDWAWQEFERRLAAEDVPLDDRHEWGWGWRPEWRKMLERLGTLVQWYELVCRAADGDTTYYHSRREWLLDSMKAVGGPQATRRELDRLRRTRAVPEAQWLSAQIARIEHEMLWGPRADWQPDELLRFVVLPAHRVVHTEADLWECVRDAVAGIQRELGIGEGVRGFWEGDEPKFEVDCQNVLWPRLRDKLRNWGVTAVEERLVGRDECDFWVEAPVAGDSNLAVAIELKVARRSYGRPQLIDSMETQLWEQYMEPTGRLHGLHIVLWFKEEERYPYPTQWDAPDDLLADLTAKADELMNEHGAYVAPHVLDVTAPARR